VFKKTYRTNWPFEQRSVGPKVKTPAISDIFRTNWPFEQHSQGPRVGRPPHQSFLTFFESKKKTKKRNPSFVRTRFRNRDLIGLRGLAGRSLRPFRISWSTRAFQGYFGLVLAAATV
jgi:hypothetical protein